MTSRSALPWLVLMLAACPPQQGRVKITILFENESRTQCIKASAKTGSGNTVNATPAAIARAGKDKLVLGLGETDELVGEVKVTVSRFATADCTGTAFASETKDTQIVHAGPTTELEFRFTGDAGGDGGTDAGTGDGGLDGGCDLATCGNTPGECEAFPATGCQAGGGCRFTFRDAGATCSAGVCTALGSCTSNVCTVLGAGAVCDGGLPCVSATCVASACQPACPPAPECNALVVPLACGAGSTCAIQPSDNFSRCTDLALLCLDGGCVPWVHQLSPRPLHFPELASTPYPTSAWNLSSPDGGPDGGCDTIISTTGPAPTLVRGDCGSPALTSATVNDAGISVITMLGLDIGPAARLHFVGTRPVQLVVIGNASISGLLSVAPFPVLGTDLPAGSGQVASCNAGPGTALRSGGGGGGFGAFGGDGGNVGGAGGSRTTMMGESPLRGGCPGGDGYRDAGTSPGGTGGGALQLIVSQALTLDGGIITASGGGGTQGRDDGEGGGGGASGGTLLIQAQTINLNKGAVTVNGGGGGEGGDTGTMPSPGAMGPINSLNAAGPANSGGGGQGGVGGDDGAPGGTAGGSHGSRGGGGGGGAVGVVFIKGNPCTLGSGLISGAEPNSFTCGP